MSDPYRIEQRPEEEVGYASWPGETRTAAGVRGQSGGSVSTLLWILAAICAGLNTTCTVAGQDVLGGLFGGLAGVSLIALLVRYLNRRER